MKSKYILFPIALLALIVAMGLVVSTASASTGTFSLSVTSGSAGIVTKASAGTGSGWNGGATVTLKWDDGVTVLGSATANGAGKWSVYITIPSSATAGAHTITVNDGQGTTGTATFTVTVSAVTMTVSYHVSDGTTPSAAPVFHYKDTSGVSKTYTLTGSAHAVTGVGAGLAWSVDSPIVSGYEQWATTPASGNAPASGSSTTIFNYNHQLKVSFDASANVKTDTADTIVTVAGSAKTADALPFTTDWINSGDTLTFSYQDTIASSSSMNTKYVWSSTSGLGQTSQAAAFTVTAPGTITASFQAQTQDTQTQISIMYTPSSANPAEPVLIFGKLTVASDQTAGISGREVTLSYFDTENWNNITTVTTDLDGSYSFNWTLPSDMPAGPHMVKAVFGGDPQGASPQYLGSEATSGGIGIVVLPEYSLGGAVAFVMCFAAFVVFRIRKNRQPKQSTIN